MCQLRDDAPTVARATIRPGVVRQPFSWRVRRYPVSLVRRTLHKAAHTPTRPPHIPRTLEQRGACGGPSHASLLHPIDSGACAGAQEQPFGAISPPSSHPVTAASLVGCAALASGYLAVPATTALTAAALAAAFTAATLAAAIVTLAFLATAARATAALATGALATTTAL